MTSEDVPATAGALVDANNFEIVGPIRIRYSSSSIKGVPLLSYKDAQLDLNFKGDEITRVEASLGVLVTVTLENVVDAFIRTFTLIVPTIRVAEGDAAVFETLGIETRDRSNAFIRPQGLAGALQF